MARPEPDLAGFPAPTPAGVAHGLTLIVLGGAVALGLSGLLGGGGPAEQVSGSQTAAVALVTPDTLRTGMSAALVVDIVARRALAAPAIDLPAAWTDGVTIRDIHPDPLQQRSVGGNVRLVFAPLAIGERLHVRVSFEVDPDGDGRTTGRLWVRDGEAVLAALPLDRRVWP